MLQQKVDEQKTEIMQICLREKELQYKIREQNLHHQMEQIQNSIQEKPTELSRLSEGNGNLSMDMDLPKIEAHVHLELERKFNLTNKKACNSLLRYAVGTTLMAQNLE